MTGRARVRRGGQDWAEGLRWLLTTHTGRVLTGLRRPPGAGEPEQGGLLLSDEDRNRAADALARAVGEGRLTAEEAGQRSAVVWAARRSGELVPVLADLPDHLRAVPQQSSPEVAASAVFGELRREGEWEVPALLRVSVTGGRAVLDLTRAVSRGPEAVLELAVVAGSVLVRVPAGVPVTVQEGLTVYGTWDSPDHRQLAGPTGFRLQVRGTVVGGRVVVRVAERRRRRFRSRAGGTGSS